MYSLCCVQGGTDALLAWLGFTLIFWSFITNPETSLSAVTPDIQRCWLLDAVCIVFRISQGIVEISLTLQSSTVISCDSLSHVCRADIVITCLYWPFCVHLMLIPSSVSTHASERLKGIYSRSNLRTVPQNSCFLHLCLSIPTFTLFQTWNIFRKRRAFML